MTDPTQYFEELYDSQKISGIGDYYKEVIKNPYFFIEGSKAAHYIRRMVESRKDDPACDDSLWLLDKCKEKIEEKYWSTSERANISRDVKNWLHNSNKLKEATALRLCYVFDLKPTENKKDAPLESAEGFLQRVCGKNFFNGRNYTHAIHQYCLSKGLRYSKAIELIEYYDSLPVPENAPNSLQTLNEGYTYLAYNNVMLQRNKALDIDEDFFKGQLAEMKPFFDGHSRTAQANYYKYKNRVMVHILREINKNNGKGGIYDRIGELANRADLTPGSKDDKTADGWHEVIENKIEQIHEKELKRIKNDRERDYFMEERKFELLEETLTGPELIKNLVHNMILNDDKKEIIYEKVAPNSYLEEFVQHLPSKASLKGKGLDSKRGEFNEKPHARDAVALFYFYDFAYRVQYNEPGLSAEVFLLDFKDLMEQCGMSQPLMRNLFDTTLIYCIVQLCDKSSENIFRTPEKYFTGLFQMLDVYYCESTGYRFTSEEDLLKRPWWGDPRKLSDEREKTLLWQRETVNSSE